MSLRVLVAFGPGHCIGLDSGAEMPLVGREETESIAEKVE
ncbi:hypothetical protein D082_22650 [Synechocystis sp. PCC 6714]|nr:hypothetical protein D082_22650 [Synechocystis sp. PCC 6714]